MKFGCKVTIFLPNEQRNHGFLYKANIKIDKKTPQDTVSLHLLGPYLKKTPIEINKYFMSRDDNINCRPEDNCKF